MGWDFEATTDKPLDVLKRDYPRVTWVCTDGKKLDGETAWFGFTTFPGEERACWVVALCHVRKMEGRRWVGYKFMDESVGPYRTPPDRFWKDPRVRAALGGQETLF